MLFIRILIYIKKIIVTAQCKREGEYCGFAGNGNDYGDCCGDMECTYTERKVGGAGVCTSKTIKIILVIITCFVLFQKNC